MYVGLKLLAAGAMWDNVRKEKNQSVAWYACEASLGKERCVRLN